MVVISHVNSIETTENVALIVGSQTCGPCQQLKNRLSKLELPVECYYIDIVNFNQQASQYGIRSLPTTLLMQNGKVNEVLVGNSNETVDKIMKMKRS